MLTGDIVCLDAHQPASTCADAAWRDGCRARASGGKHSTAALCEAVDEGDSDVSASDECEGGGADVPRPLACGAQPFDVTSICVKVSGMPEHAYALAGARVHR